MTAMAADYSGFLSEPFGTGKDGDSVPVRAFVGASSLAVYHGPLFLDPLTATTASADRLSAAIGRCSTG